MSERLREFVVFRHMPEALGLSAHELCGVSVKSQGIIDEINAENGGVVLEWSHQGSLILKDGQVLCRYDAVSPDHIQEHGRRGGFLIANIVEIHDRLTPPIGLDEP